MITKYDEIYQKSIQNRISIILGYLKYQRIPFDKDEFYQNIEVKKSIREKLKPITLEQFRTILDHTATFQKQFCRPASHPLRQRP